MFVSEMFEKFKMYVEIYTIVYTKHDALWNHLNYNKKTHPPTHARTPVLARSLVAQSIKIQVQDSKAFIRLCTDNSHTNQQNNMKNQIFLGEYMFGYSR